MHLKSVAEMFFKIIPCCPGCGNKGSLHYVVDWFSSRKNIIIGVQCGKCKHEALMQINRFSIWTQDSFLKQTRLFLPELNNPNLEPYDMMKMKQDPYQWNVDKDKISTIARSLLENYNLIATKMIESN